MRRSGWVGLFVLFLVTAWVLVLSGDAMAQKKGGGKGGKSGGKGKSGETAKGSEQKGKAGDVEEQEGAEEQEKKMEKKGEGGGKGKGEGKGKKSGDMESEGGKGKMKAYKPKGLSDKEMKGWEGGSPPGWSMGTKKGWEGADAPPGKMKKGDEAKLEKAKERVRTRIREHEGKGEMEQKQLEESAGRSIEGAARSGVPVEHAEKAVEKGIDRGMKGEEIEKMTRAMAYGADKNTDYDELGKFMDKKMTEGERGDELAMSVYKEIDDKNAVKQQEKKEEKLPWYKRWFKRN